MNAAGAFRFKGLCNSWCWRIRAPRIDRRDRHVRTVRAAHVIHNRVVEKVRQEDHVLYLDFTGGSTMQIKLEDPASSVMVRDGSGKLEYAD